MRSIKSIERLEAFHRLSEEWVWEMNLQYQFTYSNAGAFHLIGYQPDELIDTEIFKYILPEDRAKLEQDMLRCIETRKGWTKRNLRWRHKDGSIRWLKSNAEPIFEKDQLIGFRGVDRDTTVKRNYQKDKKEFISMISHELRTPLTSIHGALGLMLRGMKFSDEMKGLLDLAYRNSTRLTQILNNLLDMEKVQLGQFELHIQPCSIAEIINKAISAVKSQAEKSHLTIEVSQPINNVIVNADYERLVQVMDNLLSNAIKFSPSNAKVLVYTQISEEDISVYIRDQGKGIPKEFEEKIFEEFYRAEMGTARTTSGAGIGLSLCKEIIEQSGGKINFSSEVGVGTTFYFALPYKKGENAE